ncbi:MAG: type II CAAX endopeptidase family protein [Candidatus Thermoplasmatota archaeon]|nr:type II CAAX endopeptidase family protein [Candidatus Thermoplasmatota archaeon]
MDNEDVSDQDNITPEELDTKWHFVPPAGDRPIYSKWKFILGIFLVFLVELIIWAAYRWVSAPIYGQFGSLTFYLGHIIFAPLIHLTPILIYWKFIRKERMLKKEDWDGEKNMSINIGPFKLTRRLLFTAVLVGLFGGIVWRVTEMLVSDVFTVMFGGAQAGQINLFNVYGTNQFGIFILMTFVMFFIVGPVEEFQFRSFVHDQSARVLPMWQALIFSSVLFGLSHVPIAIFIYKLPFIDLVVAEISWMTAGAVFGALYMWSRNIFACIVMHGIGNWQLSTFWIQSTTSGTGLNHTSYLIVSVLVSIFANAILIGLFYLVHKFYWEPHRRGQPAFGGKLMSLQKAFFSHDVGERQTLSTSGILSVITILTLVVLATGASVLGTDDFSLLGPQSDRDKVPLNPLFDYTARMEIIPKVNTVNLGQEDPERITTSAFTLISSLNVTLSWEDEPDMVRFGRTYTNQPDTFRVTITGPNVSVEEQASNPIHGEGLIELGVIIPVDEILAQSNNTEFVVTVTLVESGMYAPRIGIIGYTDNVNSYEMEIEVTYLEKEIES